MQPNSLEIADLVDYAPALCYGEEQVLTWQMARAERFCFLHLVKQLKPELAIEVGTSKGGSLEVLSRYSNEVVSIDIDPVVAESLAGYFPNVTFMSGDSSVVLPELIHELNVSEKRVGLVLIDGDHSEHGVRRDINAVLQLVPKRPVGIIMHDCFHPPCREGIRTADWASSPYVHYVEVDFIGGIFVPGRATVDTSMVSGLAFALLLPEQRAGKVRIYESQIHLFQMVRAYAGKTGYVKSGGFEKVKNLMGRVKRMFDAKA